MDRLGQGPRPSALLVALALAAACEREPAPAAAPSEAPVAADTGAPAEVGVTEEHAGAGAVDRPAWPLPDEILTPWEFGLIVMDSHHLTVAQRRQRAFARRKAMMLNPDSVTARALEDLAKAAEAGEIDPHGSSQVVFTARGVEGAKGSPPAGWRPSDGNDGRTSTSAPGASASAPGADGSAPGADGSR